MKKLPHVAVLIETSRSYGRALLRGVRKYTAEHGAWSIYMELRALETNAPPWLKNWNGDGILTRTGSQAMVNALLRANVPTVELRATKLKHPFPFIGVNNVLIGQMVAEHLLDRGFRHFGIYELDTEEYFEQRRDQFIATIHKHGFACASYQTSGHSERPSQWERDQDALAKWIQLLPKPLGMFACTDQLGFWLLDACRRANLSVPEEVAVIGVENDESLCEMATPPLSSVPLNGEMIGYRAAELLSSMMNGEKPPTYPILIDPPDIVTRQSSDVVAVEHPELAQALRLIREKACDSISIADVLKEVPISRSSLERHCRKLLGRSPNQEILRIKLKQVQQLLLETDLNLAQIAARTGFAHVQYLCESFKKSYHQTPGSYRKQHKL